MLQVYCGDENEPTFPFYVYGIRLEIALHKFYNPYTLSQRPVFDGNGNLLGSAVLGWGWFQGFYQLFNLDKVDWGSMQPQGVLKHYHDLFACIWMPTTHQHQTLS